MSRRMSCSMTVEAVRSHTKTVTRRHVDTWTTLKPGDRLTLIEKGMGLAKGERQVVLAEVEIVSVEVQPLSTVFHAGELEREGSDHLTTPAFIEMWLRSHGYSQYVVDRDCLLIPARRIEWRYLDEPPP